MSVPAEEVKVEEVEVEAKFEFDLEFQRKIAALILIDTTFHERCEGLILPAYFQDECEAILVKLALQHYQSYRRAPEKSSLGLILKDARASKLVTATMWPDLLLKVRELYAEDISDRDFVVDKVSSFAKHQALESAILKSAGMLDKADFAGIEKTMRGALEVGANLDDCSYGFFDEIDSRTLVRKDMVAGIIKPDGITTGFKEIDALLYQKGWGRKELSAIMGPAKAGKSMALVSFAVKAALAGHNVIFISLEVSRKIVADRMDANISGVAMGELETHMAQVKDRVHKAQAKGAGLFEIRDYPSGTLRPQELRRLLRSHKVRGINWDLVVVDYADLMAPDVLSNEPRENSRQIYVGLRQIASEDNCAVLTATQTNREGFKAAVGKMEHVAEDINKARTVDLLLSINSTDEERAKNQSRIYFAASRNQKSGFALLVRGKVESARFIEEVLNEC